MARPRLEPTAEQLEDMRVLNNEEMRTRYGTSRDVLRRWRREQGIPNPSYQAAVATGAQPAPAPEERPSNVVDLKDYQPGKSSMLKALITLQKEIKRADPRVEEARVKIDTAQPILFGFTSDWHLGHIACNIEQLYEDLSKVAEVPGFYLGAGGDLLNNTVSAVAARGMFLEELTGPEIQMMAVEELADLVPRERWLFACLGNHEAWSRSSVDHDPMAKFASYIDGHYFGPWSYLYLTVGQQTYTILAGHKFWMHSSFNRTHMAKRAMDFLGDADLVFFGDKHDFAGEVARVRRQERYVAIAGTYQQTSRYGQGLGFPDTVAKMPGAILFPDTKQFIGTSDVFGHGVHLLASYRDDVTCRCEHCLRRAA